MERNATEDALLYRGELVKLGTVDSIVCPLMELQNLVELAAHYDPPHSCPAVQEIADSNNSTSVVAVASAIEHCCFVFGQVGEHGVVLVSQIHLITPE